MNSMRKKGVCIVLCGTLLLSQVSFAARLVRAQELQDWPGDKLLNVYNREKLTIEVSAGGMLGDLMLSTWRSWTPYRGFSKISESEFFEVTGYHLEAQKARSFHSTSQLMQITGGMATLAGIGLTIAAANESSSEGQRTNCLVFGLILDVLGLGLLYGGVERSSKRWAPVSVAQPIAEEYNYQLRVSLGLD